MKPTPASPSAHFVIPSLDGLRAASFSLVFMGHAGAEGIPGGFGVTVFFFLSGYLITTLMRQEYERTGRTDLKLFYIRRAIRIWPPFYLVLATGLALVLLNVLPGPLAAPSVLAQALHVSNYWVIIRDWSGVVPGSGVYWSLAVEEHFYLLFPALFIALNRLGFSARGQFGTFIALCALILAWRCALVFGWHVGIPRTFVATDTRIDSILFGCGLAVYRNPVLDAEPRVRPNSLELGVLFLSVLGLCLTFAVRDDRFRETIRYTIQGVALAPLFSAAVRFPTWGPFRLLNLRPVRFLGTLSYSLYLVHYTILHIVWDHCPSLSIPMRGVFSFALSFAVAYAIWYFVEEPCAVLRKNVARGMAQRRVLSDARANSP